MIIKAVTFFLIFILVLGMFGKLRVPKLMNRTPKKLSAGKCTKCGAINPKGSTCPCSHNEKR